MITKDEAMQLKQGAYVYQIGCMHNYDGKQKLIMLPDGTHYYTIPKVNRWKVTSTCKTWKRDTSRFRVGLKFGLYDYCDLDNTNCHVFQLVKPE
jgi:hypothetical protein